MRLSVEVLAEQASSPVSAAEGDASRNENGGITKFFIFLGKLRQEGADVFGQSAHGLEERQARLVVFVYFVDSSQNVSHHR